MTIPELVDAVMEAGARIEGDRKNKRIVGTVSDEVLAEIKANREEFIDAWTQRQRDRYCKAPPDDLPMRDRGPRWHQGIYKRVERYVRHQTDEVVQWAFHRGDAYLRQGMNAEEATKASLRDVLHWQLAHHNKPEEVLEGISESVRDWEKQQKERKP
jgi:hypothetical protein